MQINCNTVFQTFRVSCGPQHIVFSDPRLRVDNGFQQTVELVLSVERTTADDAADSRCVAVIHLNETHTMSGEQVFD